MTRTVSILYLLSTAIYFMVGTGSMLWGGFNMVTILASLAYFMDRSTRQGRVSKSDCSDIRLCIYVTLFRIAYTSICIVWPHSMIYSTNKILGILLIAVTAFHLLRE